MSNIPLSSVKGPQNQSAGPLHGQGIGKNRESVESASSTPRTQTALMNLRVQRHSQWRQISEIHEKVVTASEKKSVLDDIHRDVSKVGWELSKAATGSASLSLKLSSIQQKVESTGVVDGNLEALQSPPVASYLMNRVDLISSREEAEVLSIQTPNGQRLQLSYEPGQTAKENLSNIADEMAAIGVEADLSEGGQLRLTGNRSVISGQWIMVGQGVRVPAGDPVTISPMREPQALEALKRHVESGRTEESLSLVRSLRVQIEKVRNEASESLKIAEKEADASGVGSVKADDVAEGLAHSIAKTIDEGDFGTKFHALRTQANMTRQSVVSALIS